MNPNEKLFVEVLRVIQKEHSTIYFDFLSQILTSLQIDLNDPRVSFTLEKGRLTFIIGNRYCFSYRMRDSEPWYCIHDQKMRSTEDINVGKYAGEPLAYVYRFFEWKDIPKYLPGVISACSTELVRIKTSRVRRNNNKCFEEAAFNKSSREKFFQMAFENQQSAESTKIWKLGCNWGPKKPSFYKMVRDNKVVLGVDEFPYEIGGLVAVAEGHNVRAICKILSQPEPVTNLPEYQSDFEKYQIDYRSSVNIAAAEWYELSQEEGFKYELQQGICRINASHIIEKVLNIWNNRRSRKNNKPTLESKLGISKNIIYYGPPGTGKTFHLQSLAEYFTRQDVVKTKEQFVEERIAEMTWWETIAAALLDVKKSSVPELEKHEFIRIKIKQSQTSNIKQAIWGNLQVHADPSCEYVKFTDRRAPYLFLKDKDSSWEIIEDRIGSEAPHIATFLSSVKNFQSSTTTTQRNYKMITFHQNSSYEDFVEGIKPILDEVDPQKLGYKIEKGIFYRCCQEATNLAGYISIKDAIEDSPERRRERFANAQAYALFIDEVNRANISSVFGELITLMEDDKRLGCENEITDLHLQYSGEKFGVPSNLYIVGTMNTADRSVEALDTALRRRFAFSEMAPQSQVLSNYHLLHRLWIKHWDAESSGEKWSDWETDENAFKVFSGMSVDEDKYKALSAKFGTTEAQKLWKTSHPEELFNDIVSFRNDIDLVQMLDKINDRLKVLLSNDHTVGHAWLMSVYSLKSLQISFKNKIIPLLQEYFYNDYAKIGLVLGKAFVEVDSVKAALFAKFEKSSDIADDYKGKILFKLKNPMDLEIEDFRSIYSQD